MIFCDSSAILPLLVDEPESARILATLDDPDGLVVWWGTPVECTSALARLRREGGLSGDEEADARALLDVLRYSWDEVLPTDPVRAEAEAALRRHPLRSADALQLAAALTWAEGRPRGPVHRFATLDGRLASAARAEGFQVVPSRLP